MLRLIHLAFHEEYNRARNRVRCWSARPSRSMRRPSKRIVEDLRNRLNLQPLLDKQVHPELIGGIVLRDWRSGF